jgi:hypothetical protein
MRKLLGVALLTAAAAGLYVGLATGTSAAGAGKIRPFTSILTSGQEVPVGTSTAFGVAFLTFEEKTRELTYSITYQGLSSAETAAHFHGPAAPGADATVLVGIDQTGAAKQGTVVLSKEQAALLKKGLVYINIHSTNFPGGEIRGQVLPSTGSFKPVGTTE